MDEELINRLKEATIDCPDCESVEDDQYCTTCLHQGGNGVIHVLNFLKENIFLLDKEKSYIWIATRNGFELQKKGENK